MQTGEVENEIEEAWFKSAGASYEFFRDNKMFSELPEKWEDLPRTKQWMWVMMLQAGEKAFWDEFCETGE